jgi:hypothetical protein
MSTAAKARAKKKVRRQKQFIAVGSVVLLVILGFEMTKVLSHGDKAVVPPPVTTATPSVAGSAASPSPSSPAGILPDTDGLVVQRDTGQLLSFGLFESKDPFVQQLSQAPPPPAPQAAPVAPKGITRTTVPSKHVGTGLTPVPSTTPSPSASPSASPATEPPPAAPGAAGPSSPAPVPTPTPAPTPTPTPTAPEPPPTSALVSTNGVCEQIELKGTFPGGEDIFRVVSIAKDGKSVDIGVVGGSYDSGQATATLELGAKLTLVNTADGTRYVIELRAKCDVVAKPTRTATTTTTTETTPAPTPAPAAPTTAAQAAPSTTATTTTATTPIVPDSLDTTTPTS